MTAKRLYTEPNRPLSGRSHRISCFSMRAACLPGHRRSASSREMLRGVNISQLEATSRVTTRGESADLPHPWDVDSFRHAPIVGRSPYASPSIVGTYSVSPRNLPCRNTSNGPLRRRTGASSGRASPGGRTSPGAGPRAHRCARRRSPSGPGADLPEAGPSGSRRSRRATR